MSPLPEASTQANVDEASRWRSLAVLLAQLLLEHGSQRAAEAERHAAERADDRAAHQRSLVQDREDFLGIVAHELKTPIAVVKAYAELLEEQLGHDPSRPEVHHVVTTIRDQADLMATLIEDVLDVQRLRLGKLPLEISRVDLPELAGTVAQEVQQTAPRHTLRTVAPETFPTLLADRRRLRQVLVNLLDNAVKFAPDGDIEVRVALEERDGQRCAVVAIRDHGIGIDQADLRRIFEQFQQVSGAPVRGRVGLGLGLYIARQIVRAHGGDISAESPGLGLGSTFRLWLPLDANGAP